jgi:hypothetical protein
MARVLGLVILVLAACGSPKSPAATSAETDTDDAVAAVTADAAIPVSGFYCFSWIHGQDFSTPCYRTLDACDAAAAEMKAGHRDVAPCEGVATAWCALPDDERCFETGALCASYLQRFSPEGKRLPSCQTRQ